MTSNFNEGRAQGCPSEGCWFKSHKQWDFSYHSWDLDLICRLFNRNDLAIGYCKSLWESFKSLFSTLHKCILFSLCHRLTIIGVHIVACVLNILYIQRCKSVYACLLKWSFMWSKEVAMATQGQCLGCVCVCVCVSDFWGCSRVSWPEHNRDLAEEIFDL